MVREKLRTPAVVILVLWATLASIGCGERGEKSAEKPKPGESVEQAQTVAKADSQPFQIATRESVQSQTQKSAAPTPSTAEKEMLKSSALKPSAKESPKKLPKMVDLGRNTCIPCKMMAPILDELKKEYEGRAIIEVIDLREDMDAARRYRIRVIPTQIFFDADGKEVWRHEGYMPKDQIVAKLAELGAKPAK